MERIALGRPATRSETKGDIDGGEEIEKEGEEREGGRECVEGGGEERTEVEVGLRRLTGDYLHCLETKKHSALLTIRGRINLGHIIFTSRPKREGLDI